MSSNRKVYLKHNFMGKETVEKKNLACYHNIGKSQILQCCGVCWDIYKLNAPQYCEASEVLGEKLSKTPIRPLINDITELMSSLSYKYSKFHSLSN